MITILFILILLSLGIPSNAQSLDALPKREVRAAWLTTVYGLDWPKVRATNAENRRKQQESLLEMLDKLKAANFNTVLFQVRTRAEVFYPSALEPMSSLLTGRVNGNPGYDPLQFVVEECHKRGMECHAWMVTIPLGARRHMNSLGKQAVTSKLPGLALLYKGEYYLDPGNPKTKEYLMSLVNEVIQKYDVDGVHFDYLRYPEYLRQFPDQRQFRREAKGRNYAQWHRDNITEIVRYLYQGIKAQKPWIKVSTSPVGKSHDLTRYSSNSWNALETVSQDVQGWLGEGIQDQIYPMMYFRGNNFYPFALDWQEQSNGRQVIPGLGIYFLDPKEGDWPLEEIERQINFTRSQSLSGQAHYRVQYLMDNTKGLYDQLLYSYYTTPALVPALPWLDAEAPSAPKQLHKETEADGIVRLTWQAATDNDTRNAPMYVVYASDTYPVDTETPANIVAQRVTGTTYTYAPLTPWNLKLYYAVTAIDRYGNESEAAQLSR
ncbi:MAG: family 10 glycosylhydrolase [Bacteroidaceae bacterium]|nr:family 10 glycosylhydrolase [Bacteroidaceae bacterium]